MNLDHINKLSDSEKLNLLLNVFLQSNFKSISLKDFTREYLEYIKDKYSHSYWRNSRIAFNHFRKFIDRDLYLDEITLKDAESFILNLKNTTAPKAFQDYYRNIRAGFTKAKYWNYISENPFDRVRIPKVQKNQSILITGSMLDIIISNTTNRQMKDVFIFAFNTGCRVGEIINICWSDVNFNDSTITIGNNDFTTKSRKQRIIPLSDKVLEVLRCKVPKIIKAKNNYIFSKPDGSQFTTDYLSKAFKRAIRKAGLDDSLHFHDLRKGFCSKLISKGVNTFVIQQLMGHSNISTTQIYAGVNIGTLKDAISTFNQSSESIRKVV